MHLPFPERNSLYGEVKTNEPVSSFATFLPNPDFMALPSVIVPFTSQRKRAHSCLLSWTVPSEPRETNSYVARDWSGTISALEPEQVLISLFKFKTDLERSLGGGKTTSQPWGLFKSGDNTH